MAGNEDHECTDDHETNPFVNFRRFADDSIATVFETLRYPWVHFRDTNLDRSFQERQNAIWERFERSFERSMNPERRQLDRMDSEDSGERSHRNTSHDMKDGRTLAGCPVLGHAAVQDEEENNWTRDGWGRAWTIEWLDDSQYSPLKLEKERQLRGVGVNWRHAFEDLLIVDTADYHPNALRTSQTRDPARDNMGASAWKASLLRSGLLHSQGHWRDAYASSSPMHMLSHILGALQFPQPQLPQSELEFYEMMSSRDQTKKSHDGAKPGILSTLTKTERRVLPDGSTQTRTILRRRFEDGTEETEDTSEVTPSTKELPAKQVIQDDSASPPKDQRGGWFW